MKKPLYAKDISFRWILHYDEYEDEDDILPVLFNYLEKRGVEIDILHFNNPVKHMRLGDMIGELIDGRIMIIPIEVRGVILN